MKYFEHHIYIFINYGPQLFIKKIVASKSQRLPAPTVCSFFYFHLSIQYLVPQKNMESATRGTPTRFWRCQNIGVRLKLSYFVFLDL